MSLKFKPTLPVENPALMSLKNKVAGSEIEQLTKDVDIAFKAIAQELQKLRKNPIVDLFVNLSEEDAKELIEKIKKLK